MRIVLIEERDGQRRQERIYDHPSVKVGRDPAECHLVFSQGEWPMVSRRHAEFRFKNGHCLIVDTNSSFGTFLNGRRITEPAEVQPGARVQFGAGGPVMLVARIETQAPPPPPPASLAEMETRRDLPEPQAAEGVTTPRPPEQRPPAQQGPATGQPQFQQRPAPQATPGPPPPPPQPQPFAQPPYGQPPYAPQGQPPFAPPQMAQPPVAAPPAPARPGAPPPAPPPPPQAPPAAKPPAAPAQPATIELVRSGTGKLERIPLTKDVTRLGREPGVEVTIEAAAAVVSRRHAEIQRRDGQYTLVDLGSFNGTLINGQRITSPTPLYDNDHIQLGMGGPELRFIDPAHPAPAGAHNTGQRSVAISSGASPQAAIPIPVPPVSGPLAEAVRGQ
ncbi:MAG TPA: FHA domain-containing protein, partial [Pyrinomonadaceae bacterium]|nr:FHA domain-containing protein [Pyrinomonadaceae bacterium]